MLAIDIGNSAIGVGLFYDGLNDGLKVQEISSQPPLSRAEYALAFREMLRPVGQGLQKAFREDLRGVIISSVVPALTEAVLSAARDATGEEPLLVDHRTGGVPRMDIRAPEMLGADRIAVAVAACELAGTPVAAIDFGTATTVNFVMRDEKGEFGVFKGGAILPGLGMMLDALAGGTAQLPSVKLGKETAVLGKDTEESILSGVVCGTAGAVEKIIQSVQEAEGVAFRVVVTGGLRKHVIPFLRRVDLEEPHLVIKGLEIIFERNQRCTN